MRDGWVWVPADPAADFQRCRILDCDGRPVNAAGVYAIVDVQTADGRARAELCVRGEVLAVAADGRSAVARFRNGAVCRVAVTSPYQIETRSGRRAAG